jgi:hypothetical protein
VLKSLSREQLLGLWVAAVIVMMAYAVIGGTAFTVSNSALWLIAAVVPPGIMFLLWHPAAPTTGGRLLGAVDHSASARERP